MKKTMTRFVLGMALLGTTVSAHATHRPTAASKIQVDACGMPAGETLYSARFAWKASSRKPGFRIVLRRNAHPGFNDSKFYATIMKGASCEAICRARSLDVRPALSGVTKHAQAASLDLSCRNKALGALSAPATLFFVNSMTGRQEAVLRFGTWLQGYEQAVLRREVDHSARLIREMAAPPVQLAESR